MPCKGYGVSRFGTPYKLKIYVSIAYFIPCLLSSKFSKTYVHFVHFLLEINEEFSKKFVEKKLIPKYKPCIGPDRCSYS